MKWLKILKWSGLGVGVLVAGVAAFVGTRYVAAGAEYEGRLEDLAPSEVSLVIHIDDVNKRQKEVRSFLDEGLVGRSEFAKLEQSPLWRANLQKTFGPSLLEFKEKSVDGGLKKAETQLHDAGDLGLFKDVLAGEMLICADVEATGTRFVALSRVSRKVRFYWQFAGFAPSFAPSGPDQPELSHEDGVMRVSFPPRKPAPDDPGQQPVASVMYLALLEDVLVFGDSPRLLNACILAHSSGKKGLGGNEGYTQARAMVEDDDRARHALTLWMDLDRLRGKLTPVDYNGKRVSPVDAYNALPQSVIKLNYDVLGPINRIVEKNLDTRPFRAALYGIDLSDGSAISFDQYLLADEARLAGAEFAHLRKTWSQPAAGPSQLQLFPQDLVLQVSYRQSLETINNEVLDDQSRLSFVGDFTRVLQGISAEEVVMGVAPRSYQPDVTEISGVPLPAFVFAFRTPGVKPESAGTLLSGFLDNLLGRKPLQPGEVRKTTRVVRQEPTENWGGQVVYGFDFTGDAVERESSSTRLTLQTVAGVVGDWLMITNSRKLLEHAFGARQRPATGLYSAGASPWRDLPEKAGATVYADFKRVAGLIDDPRLLKTMRDAKFNPNQIEGRDPGALRRELAQGFGLDPNNVANLTDSRVTAEYERRKTAWIETCRVEGDKYVVDLRSDLNGLTFFQDFSMFTVFEKNGLHARGVVRIK